MTARPHARLTLIYLVVLLLGAAIRAGHAPGANQSGIVTMLVGAGGCAWELAQWARTIQRQRTAQERQRERKELKATRAERRSEQQERERQQRQMHLRAARQRAQTLQATRYAQAEQKAQTEAQRAARFQAVVAEASRLQALPDAPFLAELPFLFATRGLHLQYAAPSGIEADADLSAGTWDRHLLRVADEKESIEVARCLTQGRAVAVSDVEALEQWRQVEGATHAYLVSRSGFSAQAVRLAARFPLTLVEPQLLAQWQLQNQPSGERQISLD